MQDIYPFFFNNEMKIVANSKWKEKEKKEKKFPTNKLMVMLKQMLESVLKVYCFGVG